MLDAIIIVPCYNEEHRLRLQEFQSFAHHHQGIRFLMVDDGSQDGTLGVLKKLEREKPDSFNVLALEQNRGKAEAVRQGVLLALREDSYAFGYWDADLATPLSEIPRFLEALKSGDALIVFGARVMLMGRVIQRKAHRHYIGRVFATLASLSLDLRIYDTQCGAKLFRNIPEMTSLFERPFVSRWVFDVEILARLICLSRGRSELKPEKILLELPLLAWSDVPGSKVKPMDFFRGILELAKVHRRYLRPGRPSE